SPSQASVNAQGETRPSRNGRWPLLYSLFASLNQDAAFSLASSHVCGFPRRTASSSARFRLFSASAFFLSGSSRPAFGAVVSVLLGFARASTACFQPSEKARFPALPPLPSSGLKLTLPRGTACAAKSSRSSSFADACQIASGVPDFALVLFFCSAVHPR